jgi:DnaJ-class molecular chaperone
MMSIRDPYNVLGVARGASDADLKKAFRKLAKTHHPDANPNDPKAKERFSELSHAYDFLIDKDKRAAFDRGDIDASGQPRFHSGFGGGGARAGSWHSGFGRSSAGPASTAFEGDDVFADFLRSFTSAAGAQPQQPRSTGPQRGATSPKGEDVEVTASVPFTEWALGGKVRMRLPTGRELDVAIPAGIEEGKAIRLKGQGYASPFGGAAGDALIHVKVTPHPQFRYENGQLRVEVPITFYDAVLGAKVRVPTLNGAVDLTIQPRTTGAQTLRLRGKGINFEGKAGDLLVNLKVVMPDRVDAELENLARRMREGAPYDPRSIES